MPSINGRLICCSCGADLGDASDPYRDPDCENCLRAEIELETERDTSIPDGQCHSCGREYQRTPDDAFSAICPDCEPQAVRDMDALNSKGELHVDSVDR